MNFSGVSKTEAKSIRFRKFDPELPLFFSHLPKTGGTALRHVFQQWYGQNLLLHYNNPKTAERPALHHEKLTEVSAESKFCVFGHFNAKKSRGFEHSYPDASQFITVFRDPLKLVLSIYNFIQHKAGDWMEKPDYYFQSLDEYLETEDFEINSFMKTKVDLSNFRQVIAEEYVYVGLQETLDRDVVIIADLLGFDPPAELQKLNVVPREKTKVSDRLIEKFRERHQLEYAIYDWLVDLRR